MRQKEHFNIRQHGAVLVEAAFGTPLIIFLLFGIIQWGFIFMAQITITNATATAARLVAIQNSPVSENDIIQTARNAVPPFLISSRLNVLITPSLPQPLGTTITVTCSYSLPLLIPYVVPGSVGGNLTITSRTAVR